MGGPSLEAPHPSPPHTRSLESSLGKQGIQNGPAGAGEVGDAAPSPHPLTRCFGSGQVSALTIPPVDRRAGLAESWFCLLVAVALSLWAPVPMSVKWECSLSCLDVQTRCPRRCVGFRGTSARPRPRPAPQLRRVLLSSGTVGVLKGGVCTCFLCFSFAGSWHLVRSG